MSGGEQQNPQQDRMQDAVRDPATDRDGDARRRQRARRRIVFDDPMGGRSRDDSDTGWGGERGEGSRDRDWYLRETPPHHGEK